MIVAYLILAHDRPDQLARLIARLPEESPIFLHFDGRAPADRHAAAVAAVAAVRPDVVHVHRHRCRWGGAGIMRATLQLLEDLVASARSFDYAILLSAADYPIKSNAEIARCLATADGAEFLECFPLLEPNRWSDHAGNYGARDRVLGRYLRVRSRVYRLPGWRTMPKGLIPYGGGQWWCLSAAMLCYVVAYVKARPAFVRFFAAAWIPDECFMQTLIANSPFADRIVSDDLRFAIWDRPPIFPATLVEADLPALAGSPALFARKFDMARSGAVMDMIDRSLLQSKEPA